MRHKGGRKTSRWGFFQKKKTISQQQCSNAAMQHPRGCWDGKISPGEGWFFSLSTFFFPGRLKARLLLSWCYLNPPNPLKALQNFLRGWSTVGALGKLAGFGHFWAAEHCPKDFFPRTCSGRSLLGFLFPISFPLFYSPRLGWAGGFGGNRAGGPGVVSGRIWG